MLLMTALEVSHWACLFLFIRKKLITHIAAVLELEPRYLKAVMRRAQALEALEKYEDALEGVCLCVYI